jgi:hypothetical protein
MSIAEVLVSTTARLSLKHSGYLAGEGQQHFVGAVRADQYEVRRMAMA